MDEQNILSTSPNVNIINHKKQRFYSIYCHAINVEELSHYEALSGDYINWINTCIIQTNTNQNITWLYFIKSNVPRWNYFFCPLFQCNLLLNGGNFFHFACISFFISIHLIGIDCPLSVYIVIIFINHANISRPWNTIQSITLLKNVHSFL